MSDVFISYTGAHYRDVKPMVNLLRENGLACWFAPQDIAPGTSWPVEIQSAIDRASVAVVCIGPGRVGHWQAREVVWLTQRMVKGRIYVIPVLLGQDSGQTVFRRLQRKPWKLFNTTQVLEWHAREAKERLINTIRHELFKRGAYVLIPPLPAEYHAVQGPMKRLVPLLTSGGSRQRHRLSQSTVKRIGVAGRGGIGKTVVASAVAHTPDVKRRYRDGVLWFHVGPDALWHDFEHRLHLMLGQQQQPVTLQYGSTAHQQGMRLRSIMRLFKNKRHLVVLDDVWEAEIVEPFVALPRNNRIMFTTRNEDLSLRYSDQSLVIRALSQRDAMQILRNYAGQSSGPRACMESVVEACERIPLALKVAGALMRTQDCAEVLKVIDTQRSDPTTVANEHIKDASTYRSIRAGYEYLDACQQAYYRSFAVFPAGQPIPERVVNTYWMALWAQHSMNESNVTREISKLKRQHLVDTQGIQPHRFVVLHSLLSRFLLYEVAGDLQALHAELVFAYFAACSGDWAHTKDDGYVFRNIIRHMLDGDLADFLAAMFTQVPFLTLMLARNLHEQLLAGLDHLCRSMSSETAADACKSWTTALAVVMSERPTPLEQHQLRIALVNRWDNSRQWPKALNESFKCTQNFDVLLFLGETFNMEESYDRAREVYKLMLASPGIKQSPRYFDAFVRLATVEEHDGKPEEALAVIREYASQTGVARSLLNKSHYWIRYHEGHKLRKVALKLHRRKLLDKAYHLLTDVYENGDSPGRRVAALHQLACIDLATNDFTNAERRFREALRLRRSAGNEFDHRIAYEYRGLARVKAAQGVAGYVAAIELFDKAISTSRLSGDERYARKSERDKARLLAKTGPLDANARLNVQP